MADLGTVAAAVQLVETAYKLWKIFSEIRDAPANLIDVVEEIKATADLLSDIQQTHRSHAAVDQKPWDRCYGLLKSSADALRQVTDEMQSILGAHKRTEKIRLYLKKDVLVRCQSRLERVKGTMMLAQQAYSIAIFSQHDKTVLHEIHALAMNQHDQFNQIHANLAAPYGVAKSSPQNISTVDSKDRPDEQQDLKHVSRRRRTNGVSTFDIRLPKWIYRRGVQVLIDQGNSSWGIDFRTYNRLPKGSEVFAAADSGDWERVGLLIQRRDASPYDINEKGQTLLHIAAMHVSIAGCKLLLPYGLDIHLASEAEMETPWRAAVRSSWYRWGVHGAGSDIVDVLSLMLTSDSDTILELDSDALQDHFSYILHEALPVLMRALPIPYSQLDPVLRADLAVGSLNADPKTASMLLGSDLTWSWALNTVSDPDCCCTLLLNCAFGIAFSMHLPTISDHSVQEWQDIMKAIIVYSKKDDRVMPFMSLLWIFIYCYFSTLQDGLYRDSPLLWTGDWNLRFSQAARKWIGFLAEQGADLERYGRAERMWLSKAEGSSKRLGVSSRWRELQFEWMFVTYGSSVDDWNVFVKPAADARFWSITQQDAEYEMAGEFWQFVENPELYGVPGSWAPDHFAPQPLPRRPFVLVQGPIL